MAFAKHETFYIREGWLFKGMAAIKKAEEVGRLPTIFLDDNAPEVLGIGHNMVRALRFWMQATGLAEEKLEDRQHFAPSTFDEHGCLEALRNWVISRYHDQEIALGSLKRDVDCLLQTYLSSKTSHSPEELTESPFSRLHILSRLGGDHQRRYRLERLDSSALHPLVLLYVLLDRQTHMRNGVPQVGLSDVLREPMNVGRIFSLTTTALSDLLAELNKDFPDLRIHFVRTAGLDQLTLPMCKSIDILTRYYTQRVSMYV